MQHFNQLKPAEAERLALLAEECSEVIQIVGKILRHGYESHHPDDVERTTNRQLLAAELGHVEVAQSMLCNAGDVSLEDIAAHFQAKRKRVEIYLHHATVVAKEERAAQWQQPWEVEELRRDRVRLEWLMRYWDSQAMGRQPLGLQGYFANPSGSFRDAIDAAMREANGGDERRSPERPTAPSVPHTTENPQR